jgi:hypothetical protein
MLMCVRVTRPDKVLQFRWSGQIIEPNDYMAYIGRNAGMSENNVYICTGDSGNGLTHGVIAGRLLTDLMLGIENPWASLYSPSRKPKPRTTPEDLKENINQNLQFSRYLKTDVSDIESIPRCSGAVMHSGLSKLGKPVAVYKDVSYTRTRKYLEAKLKHDRAMAKSIPSVLSVHT